MRPSLCVIGPCVRLRSRVSRPRASPPGVSAGGRVRNVRAIIHAWDTCDKNVIQPYSDELFAAGVLWATALILTRLACMAPMSAPRPPRLSTVSPAWKTGGLSHRDGRAAAARQRSWLSEASLSARSQGGSTHGQAGSPVGNRVALRRHLSTPDHALCCPELRPASANQPLGPRWPAIPASSSTWALTEEPVYLQGSKVAR